MPPKPLKILPVKKKPVEDKFPDLNPSLPKHPFFLIVNAPPASGKSNVTANIMVDGRLYPKGYFDRVMLISPTCRFDQTLSSLIEKYEDLTVIDDPELLSNLDVVLDDIVKEQKDNPTVRTLLVLDDCLGFIDGKTRSGGLNTLCTRYRHYGLSVAVLSQSFRRLPSTIRKCASNILIFRVHSGKERQAIEEDVGELFGEEFMQLHAKCMEKPYGFMNVNLNQMRIYDQFDDDPIYK